ncbi:MAG TPA: hypothetical protein VH915_04535 [Pedococcus sp.]
MDVPWASARHGRGLLLLRAEAGVVARWASRGLVAARVVPLPGWTAVLPAEPLSRALPPYDDALTVLAAQPVTPRLRASFGVFAIDGRAVVTVRREGWRTVQRWLVWEPGRGVVRTPALRLARPGDLVAAAHATSRGVDREVSALLRDGSADPLELLADLMGLLGLPGAGLLATDPGGEVVEPAVRGVARFNAFVLEEARHRAEQEEETP